jgi:integrase
MLARRSEVVALQVEDVTFADNGTATVLVRRSKTDAAGEGVVLWLSPRTTTALRTCLARRFKMMAERAPHRSDGSLRAQCPRWYGPRPGGPYGFL